MESPSAFRVLVKREGSARKTAEELLVRLEESPESVIIIKAQKIKYFKEMVLDTAKSSFKM